MRCDPIDKAVEWCISFDDGKVFDNWERLDSRVWDEYCDPKRKTIMRNQVQLGFDNTIYPVLSRLLIMHYPPYRVKIHPRRCCVDNPEDIARLADAYRKIVGHEPKVYDWRDA